jgi:hypothetical protein
MPNFKCPFCGMETQYSKYIDPPACPCGGIKGRKEEDFRAPGMATINKTEEVEEPVKKKNKKNWPE